MLFHSLQFMFIFLPITFVGYYLITRFSAVSVGLVWLITASLFFYAYWDPRYLVLIVISILFNFYMGRLIAKTRSRSILAFGISANLVALFFFKYTNFLTENIHAYIDSRVPITQIILPLGISFFTFQKIAFLVDSFLQETKEYNLIKYSFFVTFFPQLIAGPIVHHKQIVPQLDHEKNRYLNSSHVLQGLLVFAMGLVKKIMIADYFGRVATPLFASAAGGVSPTSSSAWIAALAYTFQLYFDFSGYSDMAIGLALLFNLNLPINFNSPYKALSISDFWRRWHITLSAFLRDYLYIPLGGNRGGIARTCRNLFITMFLGGIWHGAGWTFLIWGSWHGFLLVFQNLLKRIWSPQGFVWTIFGWVFTFLCVVVGWVFFRAPSVSAAKMILLAMSGWTSAEKVAHSRSLIFSLLACFLGVLVLPNSNEILAQFRKGRYPALVVIVIAIATGYTLYSLIYGQNDVHEFLYFDF